MAGERFPYQSSGERGRQAKAERGKEKREREGERIGGRMGGGDETDIHSKRVLALVILSLFLCSTV